MKTIIEMARQAGAWPELSETPVKDVAFLKRFAALVTEQANAKATSSWTLMCKKMVAFEREACAKVVDAIEAQCIADDVDDPPLTHVAAAIRARGNT